MLKSSSHSVLRRIVDIRPEEAFSAPLMFAYFFLITTSTYIIKPVKISNFLEWLQPQRLPYAYLLTALIISFIGGLNTRLIRSVKRQTYINSSLIFFAVNLVLFWVFFRLNWIWSSLVYWVWADIFTLLTITQFWIMVNDIYLPRQAKRLVGFLVSGGLLGGITGSLMATFLARILRTENLLLICPFLLLPCLGIVTAVYKKSSKDDSAKDRHESEPKESKVEYRSSFQTVLKNRYLLLLSGIMFASVLVTTLVDFQFNSVVNSVFSVKDSRTAFLGTFFAGLLIFSYLFHILFTYRLLKNYGFRVALMISPVFLLLGSLSIFLLPGAFFLYWAVFLKGGDKSLAHSLNQSVREILYIPVSPDIKIKAKVFIDLSVNKLSKGIGALLLLVGVSFLHISFVQVSFIIIFFTVVWIFLGQKITKEYVGNVKKNLQIKWQDADKIVSETVDLDLTKLVFDTIQSKDRSSVLYAMNLFDLLKREKLSPEVKKAISFKSNEILACSMDSLLDLDGEMLYESGEEAFEKGELSNQVKEIMAQDVYHQVMREHIHKTLQKKGEAGEVAKMEVAKVIGMMESPSPLTHDLLPLLQDESPEVLKYAVESAGKIRRKEFAPYLVRLLSNPVIQSAASAALVEYGSKIVGLLKDYLGDESVNVQIRKAIPDILARIGTQRSADYLCYELQKKASAAEAEVIGALYRIRLADTQIQFQRKIILPKTLQIIRNCYGILLEMHDLLSDTKKENLSKDLERNLAGHLKHIFELLSLVYPQKDIIKSYQNLRTGTKKSTDYSIELLENILQKDIKESLLPLIDDISFEDRIRRCKSMIKTIEKVKYP